MLVFGQIQRRDQFHFVFFVEHPVPNTFAESKMLLWLKARIVQETKSQCMSIPTDRLKCNLEYFRKLIFE